MIINSQVIENTPLAHGYRIHLQYIFDDGTIRDVKCRGSSITDAVLFLANKEASTLSSKINNDTQNAISNDSDAPTSDATQIEIYKAWMLKGFKERDPIDSYALLNKVAQKVIDLGLSTQELADIFNMSVIEINEIINKWQYLNTNK